MKTFTNYIVGEDLNEQFDDVFGQSEELEEAQLDEVRGKLNKKGEIEMTKANFAKVHKDFKTSLKGKPFAMQIDPKTGGSALFPVKFVEEVELEEAYQQFTDKTANWGEGQAVAFGRKKGYKEVAVMNDNNSKHPMVLFALNSNDKQYIKGSNVKPGETVFRYATKISIAGDIFPLVKVNIAKGIFYNLTQESSEGTIEDAKFETRGVKLKFFRSLEGAIKESVDLQEMKAGDIKKKLDKVKGLSKSAYDQIVTLPMPVLTTMVNQLSTLVASYNEETELAESGHDDVASMKTKVKVAMMAIQKMNQELSKLPDDGELPTWWTNKVAIAVDKLDGMADYLDAKVESVDLEEMKMPKGYTDNDFVHIAKARVGSFVNPKTDKIIGFSKALKNPNKAPSPKSGANSVMRIGEAKKKKFKIEGLMEKDVNDIDIEQAKRDLKHAKLQKKIKDVKSESLARDLKTAEDAMGGSKTKEQGIQFVMDTMKVNKRKATQLVDKILKMKGSQKGKVTFKESESIDEGTRALGRGMSNIDRDVNVETAAKLLDAVKGDDLISNSAYDNVKIVKDVAQEATDLASGVKDGPSDEGLKKTAGMIAKDLNRFAKMAEKELAIMEKSSKRFEAAVRSAGGMIGKRKNLLKFREEAEMQGDIDLTEAKAVKVEGNAFTKALAAARLNGDDNFIVSGKKYKVSEHNEDLDEAFGSFVVPIPKQTLSGKKIGGNSITVKARTAREAIQKAAKELGVEFKFLKTGNVTKESVEEAVDPADIDQYVATKGDKESAKMNIIVQLRKAADVKGNLDIVFQDGKKKRVPMNIITIALNKFNSFKRPATKEKLVKAMSKSYKDMLVALKTIKEYSNY